MKFLVFIILVTSGCSIVGPGDRGVRISLGSASPDVKEPGVYFWLPFFVGMAKIDVQIQKSELEASAASSDMQEIKTHVAVNWSLSSERVVQTYKTIGNERDVLNRIISPAVNEAFKAAISRHTAADVLQKRMALKTEIDNILMTRLAAYGVILNDVSIVNLTFSKEFTEAIEQKQIAEQKAEQAKYNAAKALEDAKAEVNAARGQAEAQRLLQSTTTKEILRQRAIDKWDGHLPQILSGSGVIPILNMKMSELSTDKE